MYRRIVGPKSTKSGWSGIWRISVQDQGAGVFKDSSSGQAEGELKQVFGALKGNLLDASEQFQRCYGLRGYPLPGR